MGILRVLSRGLVFLCVLWTARSIFGCDLPSGQSLWIRLASPVSTYTAKVGDPVHAVLTQDLVCDNTIVVPMGAPVDGIVRSKRKVGWGIRHETAALELEFNRATARPGISVAFIARVDEVQNARESVRNGVIQGILSSDTFQGRINSRLIHLPTWNPYSDPVLVIYKAVFPDLSRAGDLLPGGHRYSSAHDDGSLVPVGDGEQRGRTFSGGGKGGIRSDQPVRRAASLACHDRETRGCRCDQYCVRGVPGGGEVGI